MKQLLRSSVNITLILLLANILLQYYAYFVWGMPSIELMIGLINAVAYAIPVCGVIFGVQLFIRYIRIFQNQHHGFTQ